MKAEKGAAVVSISREEFTGQETICIHTLGSQRLLCLPWSGVVTRVLITGWYVLLNLA
jgi:hypothetical protein